MLTPPATRRPRTLGLVLSGGGARGAFQVGVYERLLEDPLPIVFRNCLDALPKHGLVIRPTTVEVVVHPPIPTTDWDADDLDARIDAVRQLFLDTLEEG